MASKMVVLTIAKELFLSAIFVSFSIINSDENKHSVIIFNLQAFQFTWGKEPGN